MKFTFTIHPANRAPFTRTSDDRTEAESQITAQMFRDCFPGARVETNLRKIR